MKSLTDQELPSNRKFGFFFTLVFVVAAAYFYSNENIILLYFSIATGLIFFIITMVREDFLLPLNKLWMRFGILLGMIVSPIVLGLIFFVIFTPIAILMRLRRRDELRLKFRRKVSHWVSRDEPIKSVSFKNQF